MFDDDNDWPEDEEDHFEAIRDAIRDARPTDLASLDVQIRYLEDFTVDCTPNREETQMLMHVIYQLRSMVAG